MNWGVKIDEGGVFIFFYKRGKGKEFFNFSINVGGVVAIPKQGREFARTCNVLRILNNKNISKNISNLTLH